MTSAGEQINEGKAARIAIKFQDARKGTYLLDVTKQEAEEFGKKGTSRLAGDEKPKATAPSGRSTNEA